MPPNGIPSRTSLSTLNAEPSITLVPYGSDPLKTLAELMLNQHQPDLPDLSRQVALLPSALAISRFRRLLLDAARARGHAALLAPWCGTFSAWVRQRYVGGHIPLQETERELLLLEALSAFPTLRERFGSWSLVDALLALFDELNANCRLRVESAEALAALLAKGYGPGAEGFEPLRGEAELVYNLWTAWNQHLLERSLIDPSLQQLSVLAAAPNLDGIGHIYIVGTPEMTGAEAEWLRALIGQDRVTLLLHGAANNDGYHPDGALVRALSRLGVSAPIAPASDTFTRLLDQVYAPTPELVVRARRFSETTPKSPAADRLSTIEAFDFEQEAHAVDLAIRRWYAAGLTNIGFVTHDRKLARRVRALLERANLSLHDHAGWALSTTSAATALKRWLDCIDRDFAYAPLLELLKSPFVTFGLAPTEHETLVGIFERDIVRFHNLTSGLHRYRRVIKNSTTLLEQRAPNAASQLLQLLDRLEAAVEPLRQHRSSSKRPLEHLTALQASITQLGLWENFGADAAGKELLAVIQNERELLSEHGARLDWSEFEQWLLRELERRRFRPTTETHGIELLTLSESRGLRFDALVIAGCNREHLPGSVPASPFFNDGTRQHLGLPTRVERLTTALYDFRRLLEAAPRVLLTRRREERGEPLMPSPWLERLLSFHRLAYGTDLTDSELLELVTVSETELYVRDTPLPAPAHMPTPQLPAKRLPASFTASSHQRLLNCPYQFYATDGLGLRAMDDVREDMEKLDYGRRIHRILEAFHQGVAGLPGPWQGPIEDRSAAEALLRDIARVVLGEDNDSRLSARGWRHQWESFVAEYIAWQHQREQNWRHEASEQKLDRQIAAGQDIVTLRGRADRIDRSAEGLAILDYKTGATPDADAVLAGEHVQLPFYALLAADTVSEVGYVKFGSDGIRLQNISGETLQALARRCELRLSELIDALRAGAALPAWGDKDTCIYCRYEGVCRKEMWDSNEPTK